MPDSETLPPPQGPEYARCVPCGHIEPEHRPDAGPCLVCDCASCRPAAAPTDEDFLVAVEKALESVLLPEPGIAVLERTRDAVTGALAPLVAELRRMADEAQQAAAEAHPARDRWYIEILDGDGWDLTSRFHTERAAAVRDMGRRNGAAPQWDDGKPVHRRLVRETTTHTVEATDAEDA